MECNKDEASRAKEIAEKKFADKDIVGARKFALKAQNLFPGLEGIPNMLATFDVYISAENKVNGEADYYGILGLNPQADDETVRKQYRKLALMLHPDKNKSIGADGAFKLISEAWSLLSDKAKRVAYDQRRNVKLFQKVPKPGGGSSVPPPANGFSNFKKSAASNVRAQKSTPRPGHASSTPAPSQKPKHNTFWTVCHRCKMQYEYLRVYLNHNLLCPNCHEPFLAVETAPPPTNVTKSSTSWNFSQQRQNSNHQAASKSTVNSGKKNPPASQNVGVGGYNGPDLGNRTNFQWGPFSKTAGASTAAQAASVVQQAYEKVKREREEAQAATKKEEALQRKNHASKRMGGASFSGNLSAAKKRRGMDDVGPSTYESNASNQMGTGTSGVGTSNLSGLRQGNFQAVRVNGITKPSNTTETSQFDIHNLLKKKSKSDIHKKLNEWESTTAKTADKEKVNDGNEKANEKGPKTSVNNEVHAPKIPGESMGQNSAVHSTNTDVGMLESLTINVPDPDFHDFDKDRTEKSFGENQVWAAYDGDDGMPRYYAMIHAVMSLHPFKMRISWLNSKTNSELGPLNWVASGFSKTCGDFRVGKYEINNSLNSFSHKVRWTKGSRGVVRIYPRKGDVWALYRNWSPDWNELTADEVIHKYDMVEILEDYNEDLGVTVAPLVKVAGFKTVFHRHLDPGEVRRIPREEMFRFSHHVPSYLLTGQEAPNAPKGCRELDPAATPIELLQVISDVKEDDIVGIEEKVTAEIVLDDVEKANDKRTEENSAKFGEEEKGKAADIEEIVGNNNKETKKDERPDSEVPVS